MARGPGPGMWGPLAAVSRDGQTDERSRRPLWRTEGVRATGTTTRRRRRTAFWLLIAGLLVANWFLAAQLLKPERLPTISYTQFRAQLEHDNVATVRARGDTIQGDLRRAARLGEPGARVTTTRFRTERPSFAKDDLLQDLVAHDVRVSAQSPARNPSLLLSLLVGFGPVVVIGLLLWWLLSRVGSATGLGLGRSRAKRVDTARNGTRATFADVAGIDDAEGELQEIVDMLRRPDHYRRVGAVIPRGVLLSGPPGSGKTLLARAVAGEADVPFFSASASEFVEMVVGVGASRVRDLYDQARKLAPAIVFIDEIDAIGRARMTTSFPGVGEREQTLNQILTEMDGFDGTEGVITIAATNRLDVLDPALLRPGRFDRRVVVSPPDQKGRAAILRVHTRWVPLEPDVVLDVIASLTPGMTGADLRNVVNEAALLAARGDRRLITMSDLTLAIEKVVLGTERRIVLSPEERRRTAYHEAGHALLGMLVPGADPVRKISIIPRGGSLGVTFQSPDRDRYGFSATQLRARLIVALGGRAAEEVVFGEITTGAENDLEHVTRIARQMVGRWGMSTRIGPIAVLPRADDDGGGAPVRSSDASPATLELVDSEVRRLVDECSAHAVRLLSEERLRLDALAHALLSEETLDAKAAYHAAQFDLPSVPATPAPPTSDVT